MVYSSQNICEDLYKEENIKYKKRTQSDSIKYFWFHFAARDLSVCYGSAACTCCTSTHHVPIMLCSKLRPDSCAQVLIFFPFFLFQCNPLFIWLSPCPWVWERNQPVACERGSSKFNTLHTLLYVFFFSFLFICYLSASNAALQRIIRLCVGCMYRHACASGCVFLRSVHANTSFSTGHLTHFSPWITLLQPITGTQNAGKRPHPACHTSESQPCLSTKSGKDGEGGKKGGGGVIYLYSPHLLPLPSPSTSPSPVKPFPTHPSPRLKVALHQWRWTLQL